MKSFFKRFFLKHALKILIAGSFLRGLFERLFVVLLVGFNPTISIPAVEELSTVGGGVKGARLATMFFTAFVHFGPPILLVDLFGTL